MYFPSHSAPRSACRVSEAVIRHHTANRVGANSAGAAAKAVGKGVRALAIATAAKNLQEKLEDITGLFVQEMGGGGGGGGMSHVAYGHSEAA